MNFNQERHYCLARFWQFCRQPDKALQAYQQSLAHGPYFAKALRNIAFIHASKQRFDEAERFFVEALQLEPNDGQTHFNLGFVRDKLGRYEKAIASFTEAVKFNPSLDRA